MIVREKFFEAISKSHTGRILNAPTLVRRQY